uniref:Chromosome 1 open reading frame 94 n=1 Tax=Catagonus wagneri TaxID=51154 RepID=A0A8C3WAD7_9CETA
MRGGGGWSPCFRALGGQRGFQKDRERMASGNGLASSSALVAKRPSALGPFPRYIWIHQDTPQDSLDKTCHEIWKRVQGLPEALQPRNSKEQLSAPVTGTPRDNRPSFQEEALELTRGKDEISLLVEQEFLNLTQEHLILFTDSSGELEAPSSPPKGPRAPAPCLLVPSLVAGSSECPGASIITNDKLLEPKVAMSVVGSRQDCDSAISTVTGILRAAKVKSAKRPEDRGHSLGASSLEVSKLLAQFPLKSTETSKAPDNKMVSEETRASKDFLQNSAFNGPGPRESTGPAPFLLLPPPPPPRPANKLNKVLELPVQKKQLPVFARICSKPEVDPAVEGHHSERNPGIKELTKGRESLFLGQWPQSRKDTGGDEGCTDPRGPVSMALPAKKPAGPAEKNLLYEFLGAAKNSSGQLKLRSKVEVDRLELKLNPPVMGANKNNLKYTGNAFTPRCTTTVTSATLKQPLWLNLNYPPPPMFSNPSTFPQYQGLYPQRAARMPYQQTLHPQLGCYSQQVAPYNPPQMGQQIFRSSYTPLLSYIPFVQPNYPYPQRTPQKLASNPRDPSPMAGDGPQYLFPQAYGFGSTSGGPLMNGPYFSSSGNGINF